MSDLEKLNELLRTHRLPEIADCAALPAGSFLIVSPALAQQVADAEAKGLLRKRDYERHVVNDRLAEEVARTSHLNLHEARGVILEFFTAGGSVELFDKINSICREDHGSLLDRLTMATRLMRVPSGPNNANRSRS